MSAFFIYKTVKHNSGARRCNWAAIVLYGVDRDLLHNTDTDEAGLGWHIRGSEAVLGIGAGLGLGMAGQ